MLRNTAYLVISSPALGSADGVFEFRHDLEVESQLEKNYLVGNFGTAIQEAARYVPSEIPGSQKGTVPERRQGFSVDAGGGTWGGTLTFSTGLEDVRWGDGSGGTGEANVTETDASGADVHPLTRLQVLQYWLANTLSDSRGRVRIHIGEYTDGSFDDYRDGAKVTVGAGVYGYPIPVAIMSCEPRSPEDDPSSITGTVQFRRTQIADELVEDLADWVSNLGDNAGDVITDNITGVLPDA